jgi:hypothetical protein
MVVVPAEQSSGKVVLLMKQGVLGGSKISTYANIPGK